MGANSHDTEYGSHQIQKAFAKGLWCRQTLRETPSSSLEAARTNQIFSKTEDVLSKSGYEVRNRYVSVGACECSKHRQTRFIIILNSNEISIEKIYEVNDILKGLSIEFTNVISRHEGQNTFIVLVFTQLFYAIRHVVTILTIVTPNQIYMKSYLSRCFSAGRMSE